MESDTPRTDANLINVEYETREPDGEPSQVIEEVVCGDFARELERELAAAQKQRDEAMDERSYWYREHSRLIEKLVSLEREDNERERLDAIERNDTMTKWMDQVTGMLSNHAMPHPNSMKDELASRRDAAIAAMRKGEADGK